jgi:hypothetical protein
MSKLDVPAVKRGRPRKAEVAGGADTRDMIVL